MPSSATCTARLAALLLGLTILPTPDAADPGTMQPENAEIVRAHILATLTASQARQLHGRLALYTVVLDSPGDLEGTHDVYACQGEGDIERTVWLPEDQETEDEMVVEGVLVVIDHPPCLGQDGTLFEGFTEYRLTQARCQ